jgi:hypothetical protein
MNYLEKPSKEKSSIKLVVNSFTGNVQESTQSEEVMRILRLKQYKISEVVDVNQELVFEKEKSKTQNLIYRNDKGHQRAISQGRDNL